MPESDIHTETVSDTHQTIGEKKDPQAKADANRAEKAADTQMADRNPQDHPQDASRVGTQREGQSGDRTNEQAERDRQQTGQQRPAQLGPVDAEEERLRATGEPLPNRQVGRSFNDPLNKQSQVDTGNRVRLGHHAVHPDQQEKRMPLPGEPGWIPPARIAHPAGKPVTLNIGSPASLTGETPNAMPRETPRALWETMASTRLSALDQNTATTRLDQAISSMRAICLDFPYAAEGETAMTINFFRQLAARRSRLGTAADLGRTEPRDHVDEAVHEPPPEHFKLRALATDVAWMMETYDNALREHNLDLPDDILDRIDAIKAELEPFAQEVNEEAVAGQDEHVLPGADPDKQEQPPAAPSIAHTDPTQPAQPGMADQQRREQQDKFRQQQAAE